MLYISPSCVNQTAQEHQAAMKIMQLGHERDQKNQIDCDVVGNLSPAVVSKGPNPTEGCQFGDCEQFV